MFKEVLCEELKLILYFNGFGWLTPLDVFENPVRASVLIY